MELQFKGYTIFIDEEDYNYLEKRSYLIQKGKYTNYLRNRNKGIYFHRLVTNCPKSKQVDHINGNGLDNRKENLRICSNSQNNQNRHKIYGVSEFKGVYFDKSRNKWMSRIKINGKHKFLGRFEIESEAAKAYNYMALKYFGEYANINEFN